MAILTHTYTHRQTNGGQVIFVVTYLNLLTGAWYSGYRT